ncbi:uncharacterized protein [Nerophis lumbriciformis]|uniref:uncharacterized protein n=1 Tax=Nerophis lumbriciformis TaxID=546530 RepID=UPI002ADF7695|nr:uncharacterized protein LOC133575034 [Nerophis lumbriciformis]
MRRQFDHRDACTEEKPDIGGTRRDEGHTPLRDVTAVREQQEQLLGLLEEVKQLCLQNVEKDRRIVDLEQRVDELEQYSRMNDVVITGIKIKPRNYARAVTASSGEPSVQETQSVEQQVASYLQSRGIEMDLEHIEACHPLPMRNQRPPAVIMRFTNRKKKIALLQQGRKLKGTDVFINEHLTKKNADIARVARQLKRQSKIQQTWVTNCKIFIKLNGTPEEAKVLVIRKIEDLEKY